MAEARNCHVCDEKIFACTHRPEAWWCHKCGSISFGTGGGEPKTPKILAKVAVVLSKVTEEE